MGRSAVLAVALLVAGCAETDPYQRAGMWQPVGANTLNLAAMVVRPQDLLRGRGTTGTPGVEATSPVVRYWANRPTPLPTTSSQAAGAGQGRAKRRRRRGGELMPLDETAGMAPLLEEGRHDRPNCIAFVNDTTTETAIQEGLADVMPGGVESRRGGIRAAIAALQKSATPRVLIVDIGGEKEPLSALEELSNVVEPNVCVLVVGDLTGLDFYREVTRGVGAMEYVAKPLTREVVARHFGRWRRGGRRPERRLWAGGC